MAHDTLSPLKFRQNFGACSRSTGKLCIAVAHVSGIAKHLPDVVLKVSGNVHCQVTGRIRYTGQGLPKTLIIGKQRYFALKTFQFPQQHQFDIACSIHASSIDTSSVTSIKYKPLPTKWSLQKK